jgi:hypothetical protein
MEIFQEWISMRPLARIWFQAPLNIIRQEDLTQVSTALFVLLLFYGSYGTAYNNSGRCP